MQSPRLITFGNQFKFIIIWYKKGDIVKVVSIVFSVHLIIVVSHVVSG